MARRSKYEPDRVRRIVSALTAGNTRKAASAYGGIDQDTFIRWVDRHADFAEAVKKAESEAEVAHVANIAKAARDGSWQASAWWLERRRSEDWGRKDRLEIVSTVRQMAMEAGLSDIEIQEAVSEAERLIQESHAGQRG